MNRPPHHEKILKFSLNIVNAKNNAEEQEAYNQIDELCQHHKGTELDHPFQWETLADFTLNNTDEALTIYSYALKVAQCKKLTKYIASINLAIAELHYQLEDLNNASFYAHEAYKAAKLSSDLELKQHINDLITSIDTSK